MGVVGSVVAENKGKLSSVLCRLLKKKAFRGLWRVARIAFMKSEPLCMGQFELRQGVGSCTVSGFRLGKGIL